MTQEQELLRNASTEIKGLRIQNEIMSARLEMFDMVMAALHTTVATKNVGMSPDIAHQIDSFLDGKTN